MAYGARRLLPLGVLLLAGAACEGSGAATPRLPVGAGRGEDALPVQSPDVEPPRPLAGLPDAVRAAVDRRAAVALQGAPRRVAADLAALYSGPGPLPLWVDADGRPGADAAEALGLLAGAAAEGLEPAAYDTAGLAELSGALATDPQARTASAAAALDVGLSAAVLRYLRELHAGRVEPRAIGFRMTAPPDDHDFANVVRGALATHGFAATATAFTPPLGLYRGLRTALGRYRTLAADPTLVAPDLAGTLRPGDVPADLGALHRLLAALGDLPPAIPVPLPGEAYDGEMVAAVERFQARHGLAPDGVIGPATRAALQVPLTWRTRQIELALERLRWLPHLDEDRFLAVNIATFRLLAFGPASQRATPELSMGVIVGRALHRQTPVFAERLELVDFRPYWNVPASITRGELLPAIGRDPSYLARHDMEIVGDGGSLPATAANLALVRRGVLRIRQRPGPHNALGLVKFVFPNDYNVYMHGTPAPELFQRSRRDFSHGCVRVEDPAGLAAWVLAGEEGWTRERVVAAMEANRSQAVRLGRPLQVILYYVTAVAGHEDGAVRFADDIYGHDARLDGALRAGAR